VNIEDRERGFCQLAQPEVTTYGAALRKSIRIIQRLHESQSDERPNPVDLPQQFGWRLTLMATVKQRLPAGSIYEQIRGELLSFDDSHGVGQHVPRLRIRFGQNLFLGEGSARVSKPFLGFYQEAVMQFPRPSYSHVTLTNAEFFGGAGFDLGSRTQVLIGFKAQADVSSSGSTVTIFFGPAFSIEYNFLSHKPIHEHHQRRPLSRISDRMRSGSTIASIL
jgi:hypothetical protein